MSKGQSRRRDLGKGKKAARTGLRKIELRLVSELMQNCRRSDRELAKAMGVSQPTVSRLIKKLQKEKYIQEYAAIPDMGKLGYRILALTFVKLRKPLTSDEVAKARKTATESLRKGSSEVVMLERGIGLGYDGAAISYHTDYTSYVRLMNRFKAFDFLDVEKLESFLIDLKDEIRYRPFTLKTLAEHLLAAKEEKIEQNAIVP